MPLDKVVYSRTFHLGDHNFEKIGTEGTIIEGETKESLRDEAVKFVYDSFAELHPEINVVLPPASNSEVSFKVPPEPPNMNGKETIKWYEEKFAYSPDYKKEIASCTSIKVLESYKFIVKGKPELEQAYALKLNLLTDS